MSSSHIRAGIKRGAFTLIEVLVVVAIIALLISILLPSLTQARNISRMVVCQSHQKEVGNAMTMYWGDFKDGLPGPLHPLFLKDPNGMTLSSFTESQRKFVMSGYLNTRLRKYFGEGTFGKGGSTKQVGTCPAFPVPDASFVSASGNKLPIYHFALNSSEITAPRLYFGMTHGGILSQDQWNTSYGRDPKLNLPKKLSRILGGGVSASREWLLADAFRRPLPAGNPWPTENEPGYDVFPSPSEAQNSEWGSLSPKVQVQTSSDASGQPAPHAPFHPNKGGFKRVYVNGGRYTRFFGKVNTLFFDSHVEAVNEWKGTVVPAADARFSSRLD